MTLESPLEKWYNDTVKSRKKRETALRLLCLRGTDAELSIAIPLSSMEPARCVSRVAVYKARPPG